MRPRASKMSRLGEVAVRRRKHSQCSTSPSPISRPNDTGTIHSGDRPNEVCTIQVR
ncbi:hypothetical protein D3C86_2021290 [compost metagenome]